MAKQAIHDKLESPIKTAEAELDTLNARARAAKAIAEIKTITELLPKKQAIQQKFQQLKNSGGDGWAQAKVDLEGRIANFEKSIKEFELKAKAS